MNVSVPREVREGERRVALVPDIVEKLVKNGFEVRVEARAGEQAHFSDGVYKDAGARIISGSAALWNGADLLLKVSPPTYVDGVHEVDLLPEGSAYVGFLNPLGDPRLIGQMASRRITAFGMEMVPRIARAQSMDALSSQGAVAGYKAAVIAAATLSKFFPMLTTAAGTMRPARVFVIGAGVAGLQAIATARRLGAVVEAFDIRPAVRGEVESLGASFVEVRMEEETEDSGGYAKEVSEAAQEKERDLITERVAISDVVITTAQVPGKRAPVLVTEEMIRGMAEGSVIVDLAAEQGGNCQLTRPGEETIAHGVRILGPLNLPSSMPLHASQMYAKNASELILYIVREGRLSLDFEDEVIDACCVTHEGQIRDARVRQAIEEEVAAKG